MATQWGIFSCGKISHDFVSSLASLPTTEHKVVACAARNLDSAKEFAKTHGIEKAYDSYEVLAKDPDIQVIYVAAINTQHLGLAKLAIENGKNVLVEKPLCMNVKQAKELIDFAREKKVFLMEGIWSRFFPVYQKIREDLASQTVGDILQVTTNFGTILTQKDRCRLKELGGGATLDIGVYCAQFVSFIFGGERPEKILAAGHLNSDGIDDTASATLIYSGGRTATIVFHGKVKMENDAFAYGTKGFIKVPLRFWCPTQIITPTTNGVQEFQLPSSDKTFNYANSVGLCYEAQEVRRCIQDGLLESPLMTLDESLIIAEIMESIRKQVGVVYPQDE